MENVWWRFNVNNINSEYLLYVDISTEIFFYSAFCTYMKCFTYSRKNILGEALTLFSENVIEELHSEHEGIISVQGSYILQVDNVKV